jgi:hypothetical protein
MSGEFGDYGPGGFFHWKIDNAASDALGGRDKLTRLWGEFLNDLRDLTREISYSEACDTNEDSSVEQTAKDMPKLEKDLRAIKAYVKRFQKSRPKKG